MPMHDWTRVAAGIFHAFHHDWITESDPSRACPDAGAKSWKRPPSLPVLRVAFRWC